VEFSAAFKNGVLVQFPWEIAWENLQEILWLPKDTAGVQLPLQFQTIDLEGRIVSVVLARASHLRGNEFEFFGFLLIPNHRLRHIWQVPGKQ
jgi:hypothetical protein